MKIIITGSGKVGFTLAEQLVLQTVYGSARLALETGEHPAVLKGRVTSPGGTTITGLQVLEEGAFRGLVMNAVQAATARSRELTARVGNQMENTRPNSSSRRLGFSATWRRYMPM